MFLILSLASRYNFVIHTKLPRFHFLQLEKFKNYDFGRCPRVYCCGQPCLPAGQSDIPRSSTVKVFCPKCEDLHYPRSKYQGSILLIFHSAEIVSNVCILCRSINLCAPFTSLFQIMISYLTLHAVLWNF
jgi:hypothetical protein